MKNSALFFLLFTPFLSFSQLSDNFSDGNFTENPVWKGNTNNFRVNESLQLQSAATAASASGLFTASEAIENATWECRFIIDYPTSSTNYACMYLIADSPHMENGLNGYFVQVGGTSDDVSLYLQQGQEKIKIIDGTDKRTDGKPVHLTVRVTRDSTGVFTLFSKLAAETAFFTEGTVRDRTIRNSAFFGLSFNNTATTGLLYCFDDVVVTGQRTNYVPVDEPLPGEIIINEVMFNQPDSSFEYIEFYNRSDKKLDCSGLLFTTLKSDGTWNSGHRFPAETILSPGGFIALTTNPEKVRSWHHCPDEAVIIAASWSSLNNEAATLILTSTARDSVYDSFSYHEDMHHVLIKNPKGVALERIYPDLPAERPDNWHSAASVVNYGTPGYRNSQFKEEEETAVTERYFYSDMAYFSPDNDGTDDVFVVTYALPGTGFVATISILSVRGEMLYSFPEAMLLATEGKLFWDGRTNRGKLVQNGIYVLYISLFHPLKGQRMQMKLPVVVSSR